MTTYTAPPDKTTDLRSLWLGLLGGPLIWSVYFMAGYGLVEFTCKLELLRFSLWGISAISAVIIGLTVVALLATLYAGFLAYRGWQHLRRDQTTNDPQQHRAESSREFMALAGVLLCGLFALLILFTGVPAFILRPC